MICPRLQSELASGQAKIGTQWPPTSLTQGNSLFNYNELFCHMKYPSKEGLSLPYVQVESLLNFYCDELVISECDGLFLISF